MSAVALDTSVVVAALLGWHEAHDACADAVARALDEDTILPQSALIESYSVMTRLPSPHRVRPADAMQILAGSFRNDARIVALRPGSSWELLSRVRDHGVTGGLVYDARILAEARTGHATRLLTLNPGHFERLVPGDVDIVDPTSG